jgi:phage FluMu protein Com
MLKCVKCGYVFEEKIPEGTPGISNSGYEIRCQNCGALLVKIGVFTSY